MPNPSLPSRPYLEFAERIATALRDAKLNPDGVIDLKLDINAELLQAERHARLLETIREWANQETAPSPMTFYAYGQLDQLAEHFF